MNKENDVLKEKEQTDGRTEQKAERKGHWVTKRRGERFIIMAPSKIRNIDG